MSTISQFGIRLLAGSGMAIVACSASSAVAAQTRVATYSISEQSFAGALNQVAMQSGYQLVIDGDLTRNRTSGGLRGRYTLEQAMERLLTGTGLTYSIRGNLILIRRARMAERASLTKSQSQAVASEDRSAAVPVAQAPQEPESTEAIVVTGTRITRKSYDTPQPVGLMSEGQIEATGVSNVGDVLGRMPQVGVGLGQANSYYNQDAGAAFINLRGLGTNRTLVLVNGRRRVSGTELSSAVDLTTIPANMIDRVEVITGGAAAVYGADAVTGVVNVTLKNDIQGIELSARSGISGKGDAGSYSLGAVVGSKFADERGSVTLGISYNKENALMANQRAFGRNQVELFGNPDNTGPNDGIADSLAITNYRYPGTSYGGTFNIGGSPYTFDGGRVRPLQNDLRVSFWGVGGDGFNDADFAPLRNDSQVLAGMVHLQYQLSDAVKFFADAQYSHSRTIAPLQPTFDLGITITSDNPLIPADVRSLMAAAGQTSLSVGRTNIDQGINIRTLSRDTVTGVAGLEGELGGRYNWLVFYQNGRYENDTSRTHNRITARFNQAVDVVMGPNGPVCRDPAARVAGCVPLNLFGPSAATPAALNYFDYTSHRKLVNTQQVAGAQITGKPFDLPAGPLQIALGVEYRDESTEVIPDPLQASGQLLYLIDGAIAANYNVKEAFGEALVPILADQPFAKELSLEGAVRFSNYSSIGNTTAWKLGGQWAPSGDIRFRVTRSRSVRAPNLSELFSPGGSSNVFVIDPCDASRINLDSRRAANCAALNIAPGYVDPLGGVFKTVITSGNSALGAETSNSWTVGTVLSPSFIPGLYASIDWWKIDLNGAINTVPIQDSVDGCVDASTIANPFCQLITRRADGAISRIDLKPINVGSLSAEGIDFQANYRQRIGAVQARLGFGGTYLIRNQLEVVAGDPTTQQVYTGAIDNPRWRFNVTPGITLGAFSLDWTLRYISSSKVDPMASAEARNDNNVASRLYNDIYANLEVNDRMKLYVGINNLFDVSPPFSRETFQGTGRGSLFDNIGRYFYLGFKTSL